MDDQGRPLVEIVARRGDPPNWYRLTFRCRSLVRDPQTQQVDIAINHQVEFSLGEDYPATPPSILVTTAILHPNIGDGVHGGYVCPADDYNANISLAELVRQVGEMIRLANYWEADPTRSVYETLQKYTDRLPVDQRSFPEPAASHARATSQTWRIEVPQANVVLRVRNIGDRMPAEIAEQVARDRRLPLLATDGRPIHYELAPQQAAQQEELAFVLQAAEPVPPQQEDSDFVSRFLGQVKAANPSVFDFSAESSPDEDRMYRLVFNLETFAPTIAAGGTEVYVRTRYNEARLRVPGPESEGQISITWLTPIFHPYLEPEVDVVAPARKSGELEMVFLFETLAQFLAYRSVEGLEIRNPQAMEWIRFNEARVEWLRRNNPQFDVRCK
ncbi:hypothetical protein TFLX_03999 [Thermoflexales bacterium]|nr:hypothetical protein TFLX_03999 [Thermoflexales bacterium]